MRLTMPRWEATASKSAWRVLYPWHTKALVGHERAMSKASKANITAKVISFDNGCAASINSRPANTAKLE